MGSRRSLAGVPIDLNISGIDSGYHREILYGWGSLRVALFAAGEGTVIFKNFRTRGLDGDEQ